MNELDRIVYKVADALGRRNDVPFIRMAQETAVSIRAVFLRRDFDKNYKYRPTSLQNLGAIPLEPVSEREGGILSKRNKLKVTKVKIPLPVETKHVTHYMFIGSPDGTPECQLSTKLRLEYATEQDFPNLFPSYYIKDQYIYVADYEGSTINPITMFKDPREAAKFSKYPGSDCSVETRFYTPEDMIHDIELEMFRKFNVNIPEQEKVNNDEISL